MLKPKKGSYSLREKLKKELKRKAEVESKFWEIVENSLVWDEEKKKSVWGGSDENI